MPLTFLGSDLIESIRNISMVPDTGATGREDADLLRYASEGVREYLLAKVAKCREEYFNFRTRTTVVSGKASYRMPPRAMWQKLRHLWGFDGTNRFRIAPADDDSLDTFRQGGTQITQYLVEGNEILLIPDLASAYSGFLEFVFYCSPGDLILEEDARQVPVGGIDTVTKTITFANDIPTSWTTLKRFDIHSEHSGAEIHMLSEAVTVATGPTLTFSTALDGSTFGAKEIQEGDWVCLTGEAALPGVPAQLHPIVARCAALKIAESIGDTEKTKLHGGILDKFLKENLDQMETRIESDPIRLGSKGGLLGTQRAWGLRNR